MTCWKIICFLVCLAVGTEAVTDRDLWEWPQPRDPDEIIASKAMNSTCLPECHVHGTCFEELGRCDCPPAWTGPACNISSFPACTLSEIQAFGQYGALYRLPCSEWEHKPCACAAQCAASQTSFYQPKACKNPQGVEYSATVILRRLAKCPNSCHFHGRCGHLEKCQCFSGWTGPHCQFPAPSYCVGGCSGRGTCVEGTCHCDPPFYGIDCSMYRTKQGSSRLMYKDAMEELPKEEAKDRALRIYVYDLPGEFNTHLYYHKSLPLGDKGIIHPSLGGPKNGRFLNGVAELFLHEKFLTSAVRTTDPEEADLFYVPTWQRAAEGLGPSDRGMWVSRTDDGHMTATTKPIGELTYFTRVVQHINKTWPFWARNQGRDHIFTITTKMGVCDQNVGGDLRERPEVLKNVILLTHFGSYKSTFGDRWKGPCYIPGQDVVIPPPPGINLNSSKIISASSFRPLRHTQLFFGGFIPKVSFKTRHQLDKLPSQYHRLAQVRHKVYTTSVQWNQVAPPDRKWYVTWDSSNYTQCLGDATFCLVPGGIGPGWGVRIVHAVTFGCIPVIIQDYIAQPFEDILPYEDFSIRVNESSIRELPYILGNISDTEIERLQAGLECVAPRFLWSSVYGRYGSETGRDDAFQTLLSALTNRAGKGAPPPPKIQGPDSASVAATQILKKLIEDEIDSSPEEDDIAAEFQPKPSFHRASSALESQQQEQGGHAISKVPANPLTEKEPKESMNIPVGVDEHTKHIMGQVNLSNKYSDPVIHPKPARHANLMNVSKAFAEQVVTDEIDARYRGVAPVKENKGNDLVVKAKAEEHQRQVQADLDKVRSRRLLVAQSKCNLNLPVREQNEEHPLCHQYCPYGTKCVDTEAMRAGRCLHAPTGQPDWVPWPAGGASHV